MPLENGKGRYRPLFVSRCETPVTWTRSRKSWKWLSSDYYRELLELGRHSGSDLREYPTHSLAMRRSGVGVRHLTFLSRSSGARGVQRLRRVSRSSASLGGERRLPGTWFPFLTPPTVETVGYPLPRPRRSGNDVHRSTAWYIHHFVSHRVVEHNDWPDEIA